MSKKLLKILKKHSGRNSQGKVTVRHQGGGEKKYLREIDFKRDKYGIPARVELIEYDPNRTANIALLVYKDGERRYILAPNGLKVGDEVISGEGVEPKLGNALPLKEIPVGTVVHNIELKPKKGGQLVRGGGGGAVVLSREGKTVSIKLPSGEERKIPSGCFATVGQVSRPEWKTEIIGKAGRSRHMGIRPTVRGVAQHPASHPHGGGEGRSGIGMPGPKTPWGKPALGKKTRKRKKYSDKLIVKRRK